MAALGMALRLRDKEARAGKSGKMPAVQHYLG